MNHSNGNGDKLEKSYIEVLRDAQEEFPGMILPSMGMLDNEVKVNVNGKDYIKKDEVKEN